MQTQNTTSQNSVVSEIASFFQQWDEEAEAMQRGLEGYAITTKHAFINMRMQEFRDRKIAELRALEAKKRALEAKEAQNTTLSDENRVRGENELL